MANIENYETVCELLSDAIAQGEFITATLSQMRRKDPEGYAKVTLKPVELRNKLHVQFTYHYSNKVTHENIEGEQAAAHTVKLLKQSFRQALVRTVSTEYQILISKKDKLAVLRKQQKAKAGHADLAHNRKKRYILEEGKPVPFLVELGIMNQEGKVLAKKYDKFKQINRFLEMIQDVAAHLPQDRTVTIVDFGCGKSYLTFALYHLLAIEQKRSLQVIGLDLKADVIRDCSQLAERLGYDRLRFLIGDIAEYDELEQVDMVVTLHACDIATDAALEKAVRWNAGVIMSVPCCQHELYRQVSNPQLEPLLSHGILKERFAALATDAVRAKLLDVMGYKTQLLEFIDLEHTPKNIMIRAVKSASADRESRSAAYAEYAAFRDTLHIAPYLERVCQDLLPIPT
ncbi:MULTISPECIES: SAM-dependent methyltransferase [unclassified Paenibacillus]|uniref:class I SAM-dependent methyltransferase n=1 Tax=unclassified Paenibacillus TaxID=185978 RepID=UPI001C119D99|nr:MULTISPECIES: SAM-dependent methyltransferase [unclassified Paenibacillus]MBU5442899.1 SAM-dependent methyltransferase [Paenibacillus sp. MSJ-34]CAH0119188.1 hypothetical protein PAE9249_01687 [Paenibacillus sp. CECT 9249]